MDVLSQANAHRGVRLLEQHLESLDPETVPARERLEDELGPELARTLVFALVPRRPAKAAGVGAI
jgi:anti-sigma factor RsiW